jgi:hypothetical protein
MKTLKKMQIVVAVIVACTGTLTFADDVVEFGVSADFYGKYIWRGQNFNDDPAIQPSISAAYKGLTASLWGSFDTTNYNGNSGDFSELDYTLDYSAALPGCESIGYSVGLIYYDFPGSPVSDADTTEIYAGLSLDALLSPSVTIYRDVDECDGTYVSLGVGHSFEDVLDIGGTVVGVDVGASLGWGSTLYNKCYWGANQSKLNDLVLSVSIPLEIGGWSIAPSLNYVTLVSDDIRATDAYDTASDYLFAGIGFSKSF